jgi:hypothetical protein
MKGDNKTRTTYNKKGSPEHPKLRVVIYPEFTLDLIKQHIEHNAIGDDDYVFSYNGHPITKSMAHRAFIVALIKAGLTWNIDTLKEKGYWLGGHVKIKRDLIPDGRRLITHSLRYTYVTKMSELMEAKDLMKFTGHDSIGQVNYYNRTNLERALASIPGAPAATAALLPTAISSN